MRILQMLGLMAWIVGVVVFLVATGNAGAESFVATKPRGGEVGWWLLYVAALASLMVFGYWWRGVTS